MEAAIYNDNSRFTDELIGHASPGLPSNIQKVSHQRSSEGTNQITVEYEAPNSSIAAYSPVWSTVMPGYAGYILSDSNGDEDENTGCGTFTETYEQKTAQPGESSPDDKYQMRTSEQQEPIHSTPRFWKTKPPAPVKNLSSGLWECQVGGEIADWAKGYVMQDQDADLIIGAMKVSQVSSPKYPADIYSFPACHPKFGQTSTLTTGAEWICTSFNEGSPQCADLADTYRTVESPPGLDCVAPLSDPGDPGSPKIYQWLYVGFSAQQGKPWWEWTRVWRYNEYGWDTDQYPLVV